METLQKVYRTKLPPDELAIWAETLKDYSLQEFDNAMKQLIANPPKYELEDGTIQVWRGMPKLPDVIDVMLREQEKRAAAHRAEESRKQQEEFADLERRRAAGEKFYGLADLAEEFKRLTASKQPPVLTDAEYADRTQQLEHQKQEILRSGK